MGIKTSATLIKNEIDISTAPLSLASAVLNAGSVMLSMIAKRDPLLKIEKEICKACETVLQNSICSLLVLDKGGNCFDEIISTSLPKYFTDVFLGEGIGPMAGSCGKAAYKKTRIISSDISSDPLWVVHRSLALDSGLKASWSTPVFNGGEVYAILNIYKKSVGDPTNFELAVMDYFVDLLTNAVDRHREYASFDGRETENHILKSQDQFHKVIESITGVYWVNDLLNKKTLYVSPSYEKIWGRKCESLYTDESDFIKAIHPDDVLRVSKAYSVIKNNVSTNIAYRIVKPDGKIRSINAKIKLVDDTDGRKLEYGYAEDVTDRIEAERKSELLLSRNQQILKNMLDGFLLADINGKVIIANQAYANMVGYELEEVKAMNIEDLEVSLSNDEIKERITKIINEGALLFETKHKRKDGAFVDLEVSISVMEIDEKPMITAFMRDITHKKQDQEKLIAQFHQLEKYAFINSHEVRARVATMLGLMTLYLREYISGEEKKDVIHHLFDETNKLDKIIRDLSVLITDDGK